MFMSPSELGGRGVARERVAGGGGGGGARRRGHAGAARRAHGAGSGSAHADTSGRRGARRGLARPPRYARAAAFRCPKFALPPAQ